jgi:hypothetical protein
MGPSPTRLIAATANGKPAAIARARSGRRPDAVSTRHVFCVPRWRAAPKPVRV